MDDPPYDPTPLATTLYAFVTELLRVPPIKQGLRDVLEIYSITGQSSSVLHTIHDQLQAIAEILTIAYSRLILHDRLAAKNFANVSTILTMLQAQSQLYADPAAEISVIVAAAVTQLRTDTDTMLAELESEETHVKGLLSRARDTAEGIVRTVETLRVDINEAATTFREGIADGTARDVAADATAQPAQPTEPAPTLRAAAAETAAAAAHTLRAAEATETAIEAESST